MATLIAVLLLAGKVLVFGTVVALLFFFAVGAFVTADAEKRQRLAEADVWEAGRRKLATRAPEAEAPDARADSLGQ